MNIDNKNPIVILKIVGNRTLKLFSSVDPNHLFGILYGGIIASSYFIIKVFAENLYYLYFIWCSLFLAFFSLFFIRFPIPLKLTGAFIRATLYAVTNFLILTSQNKSSVSSSLSASLIGGLFVTLPSLLNRPIIKTNLLIVLSFAIGVVLLYDRIQMSYLALLSGIVQALTFSTASKVMRVDRTPIAWNLFLGFSIVAVIGITISEIVKIDLSPVHLKPTTFMIISTTILIAQITFFKLYRMFSAETAARFSLGRIPWAFGIEMIHCQKILQFHTLIGAFFITVASLKKSRDHQKKA